MATQAYRREILREYSTQFIKAGWAVICPIENDEWAFDRGHITYFDTIDSDLAILAKCDAVFFCPGWEDGHGTLIEHKFAKAHAIRIITVDQTQQSRVTFAPEDLL